MVISKIPELQGNETLYDILARLCYMVNYLPDQIREDLKQSAVNPIVCKNAAENRFCSLNMKAMQRTPRYQDLAWLGDKDLMEFLGKEEKTLEDWKMVLGVVWILDYVLQDGENLKQFLCGKHAPLIPSEDGRSNYYQHFLALNTHTWEMCGRLLPRVFCEWEKESDRTMSTLTYKPLQQVLRHHIWIPPDKWDVQNLYCDFRNAGQEKLAHKQRKPFRIVSSPLLGTAPFKVELDKENSCFYIRYDKSLDHRLIQYVHKTVDIAIESKGNIVIFPEMLGTQGSIKACVQYIQANGSPSGPHLYLLPTWEYEESGTWRNALFALDASGNCVFQYFKRHPFLFDVKPDAADGKITFNPVNRSGVEHFFEPIKGNGKIYIIHVPGLGRIGCIICADVFEDGYLQNLIQDFELTLLLCPVFSYGKDCLKRALAPALQYSCDVVLCNTCAAWDNLFVPTAKRSPSHKMEKKFINPYYSYGHAKTGGDCEVKCRDTDDCSGCYFITDLAKSYSQNQLQRKWEKYGGQ